MYRNYVRQGYGNHKENQDYKSMIRFLMLLLNICHFAKEYGLHVIKQRH